MTPAPVWLTLRCLLFLIPAAADAAGEASARTVTVSGHGEIEVEPERALVSLGVEARQGELQAARQQVNGVVEDFLELCDQLRIPRDQVRTFGLHVQPEYDWSNETRERRLIGYYVSRQLQVDLRDLERLGQLLERAIGLGVNQASPPQLAVGDEEALRRQALAKAAVDARSNAETLARALGAAVGKIRRIASADVSLQPPPVQPMMQGRAMMAEAGGDASYETGLIEIRAQVTAEFDLLTD